jgi:hypothetical protein
MMVVIIPVVMMMVVMASRRTAQLVKCVLQGVADCVHLRGRLVKGRYKSILVFVGHRCPPFIEFGDVTAVVFNPMLEKHSELFSVFHCRFLKTRARKAVNRFAVPAPDRP